MISVYLLLDYIVLVAILVDAVVDVKSQPRSQPKPMKTCVSVVCYRYKVLANGESPLMLRISKEGRRTMKSLGVSVDPKFWNFDTNQPKPNCPNRQLIRQIMLKYESEYNGKILAKEMNEEEFTPQMIVAEQKERIMAQTVEEVYKAMEQGVYDGKVKSIGISNYYTKEEIDEVLSYATIVPAVIQNENHIYYQNADLKEYVSQYGIIIESWYPFGGRGHTSENFNNEVIRDIATKYNKTSSQIILRWQLQAGYIVIPGSSNPDHILENYSIPVVFFSTNPFLSF